ncbi:hypothetical protein [Roseinatronobacter sp. S2]|uniref:hypothetical protein n=1 Tax=Roseinatronobacter sp. S2 TaxID=3035471 RepID=UPI002410AB11|nr:hypothetical protein [Roseinatronobacter sp. S2]WFE74918.1 hypothetical protein P8S53_00530 [Roseinatronobacter sp. S2]
MPPVHNLRESMMIMEKNKKKKSPGTGSKGTNTQSDYKTRQSEGKTSQADSKFQKQIGKAKDTLRKG